MMRYIFDTWQDITPHIADLINLFPQGVDVIRYAARGGQAQWKTIKSPEARAIAATQGKIRLGIVYEVQAQTFGFADGVADGQYAFQQCQMLGAPPGFFLAYASDADYPSTRIGAHGQAFHGFFSQTTLLKPQRWCYGAGATCDYLEVQGFIDQNGTWLTQSHGFDDTKKDLAAGAWDMDQKLPTKLLGMDIDPNVLRDPNRDAGFFIPNVSAPTLPDSVLPGEASTEDVEALQIALNADESAGLVVDGRYGPETHAAVLEFQKAEGLVADGLAGPLTIAKLKN